MPSVQDIESRLGVVERKLEWLLNFMAANTVVPTGLMAPDGRPQARMVRRTFLDLYREAQTSGMATGSPPTPFGGATPLSDGAGGAEPLDLANVEANS